MPNIKSAKKRVSVIARKTAQNRMVRSKLKTTLRKVDALKAEGDKQAAGSAYIEAQKALDQAVSKGLMHKNTAARRKSRLAKGLQ